MRIPIERLKELSKRYDLSHLILFAYHPESNAHHIVTYGKSIEGCGQAADFGNKLKEALGWPDSLQAQPSRVKRLQERLNEKDKEIRFLEKVISEYERDDEIIPTPPLQEFKVKGKIGEVRHIKASRPFDHDFEDDLIDESDGD